MEAATAAKAVEILLFSDNVHTRQTIMDAAGLSAAFELPAIRWHEVATSAAVKQEFTEGRYRALVLDADAQPEGGQSLARWLSDHADQIPPIIMLVSRQQDEWLSRWAGSRVMVLAPYEAAAVTAALKKVLSY